MTPGEAKPAGGTPTTFELREIALAAMCDVRTLQRALRGERIQHLSRERIRRALVPRGLEHLLPQQSHAAAGGWTERRKDD